MKKYIILILSLGFLTILSTPSFGQKELNLTLAETVAMAQGQAPDALLAETRLTNNYWFYRTFLSNYKPQIRLNSTLPNLNRSIEPITLPDGTLQFVPRSFINSSLNISMRQQVTATGGEIFASTSLQRIDIFSTNNVTSYLATPISIGFNQPLFAFNELKWDKEIEPLRFEESKRQFSEEMEVVAAQAVQLFFDVMISQLSLEAAQRDRANADTLYLISQGRYNVGKIAETELLQVEISKMNADAREAQATLDLQRSTEDLRNFLGIKEAVKFNLFPPTDIPEIDIEATKALDYARKHRSVILAFQRRLLEAEANVIRAQKQSGPQVNLFGIFGLTQTAESFGQAYINPLDQEQVTLGIEVPIMDWGRAEARRQVAASQQKLETMNVEQEKINFERDILLNVQQFQMIRQQTVLALRSYEIAQKTYDLSQKRYLIGKIGITDLNIALSNQETARRGYMTALRSFWSAYYEIRRLTLYDFLEDRPLIKDTSEYN